jgi:hypothetical protein
MTLTPPPPTEAPVEAPAAAANRPPRRGGAGVWSGPTVDHPGDRQPRAGA